MAVRTIWLAAPQVLFFSTVIACGSAPEMAGAALIVRAAASEVLLLLQPSVTTHV